jgi:NAD+ synthase (glutamine-hydrolysing)
MVVKVAIAQINPVVGDLEGNSRLILRACEEAVSQGALIVLTPELSLAGYPPEDLLLRFAFYEACDQALDGLAKALRRFPGLHVVVGHPHAVVPPAPQWQPGTPLHDVPPAAPEQHFNAASVLAGGVVMARYFKHELPNYDVFDELRYFDCGDQPCTFVVGGISFGINICEDIWFPAAPAQAAQAGAQVLLVLNASPYHMHKGGERLDIASARVQETGMALVYANLVGGQDELQFDGASFVVDAYGRVQALLPHCKSVVETIEVELAGHGDNVHLHVHRAHVELPALLEEEVYAVLVQGVHDYVTKNGFPGAIIGLSGGIDSALVLAIAVDALGADRVRVVMMPSPYTADISWIDARDMAQRLGVRYDEISITPVFESFRAQLAEQFVGLAEDATEENIQARIRGTLLMALSNKTGAIVLTTGNKSEMATGYCTLYGDMAGGYAVIKDIFKMLVFRLARWRNALGPKHGGEVIPERIITRPPSAELRPNQTDQDSLPPYDVLDEILRLYMEEDQPVAEILRMGYERTTVERVVRLLKINEYKRRQAPVGVRVSQRAFGRDWRYPITNRFREAADH